MTTQEVFEIASAILVSVGGAGIIILSLSGWLGKVWANRMMQKEIAKHNSILAELKSQLSKNEVEHQVRFSEIYLKQAEVISELYSKLFDVSVLREKLIFQLRCRDIRESAQRERINIPEWELISGIHTLLPEEKNLISEFRESINNLHMFYGKKRLYLTPQCCELMDRITMLSSFMQTNYSNLAIKGHNGELMVHQDIKGIWEKSVETIPQLLTCLENEFKIIIGFNNKKA